MRFTTAAVVAAGMILCMVDLSVAKKPSRARRPPPTSRRSQTGGGGRPSSSSGRSPVSKRRPVYDDDDDSQDSGSDDAADPFELDAIFDEDEDDMEEEPVIKPKNRRPSATRNSRMPPPGRSSGSSSRRKGSVKSRPPPRSSRYEDEDDYDDEYSARRPTRSSSSRRGPPSQQRRGGGGGGRPSGGRVVRYQMQGPGAAAKLTKGWAAVKSVLPDPGNVKDAALSGISAARQTTSNLSSNIYREVKGLTSSELEQVMLKATRPDDTAVKSKHAERLVGVTYQISSRYDIYDAVLRKLWSKMAEKDWRTTIKALYILHRYSADGAPEHAPALKARLRELRRTRDPKRKDKFFNSKQLLAGDADPETIKFRAFMSRYAHYVLLRVQCFSGLFDEIGTVPKPDKKKGPKPITSTCLRAEHLNAAGMLLKAGVVCQLKEGEECENTAIASERVASDMIGLTTAVAIALNRALKGDDLKGADPAVVKKWCVFYSEELLPQTKAMVKKTSPKLDAYGLFLPSRMGTSVSRDLLEKGLHLEASDKAEDETSTTEASSSSGKASASSKSSPASEDVREKKPKEVVAEKESEAVEDDAIEEEAEFDDEYEYEEEEYYDEEE